MFSEKSALKIFAKLTGKYVSEQAWNFIKKETPAQAYSCDFYEIFLEHLYHYYFNHQFLEFFFLLTHLMCIYWSFGSLCICFCSTYQVITIIQIILTLTKFELYVCWLNKLPVLFFESMNWCKKEKKHENSSECFTHGLGKTIRVFNQVLSIMSWVTKLKFSSTILQ